MQLFGRFSTTMHNPFSLSLANKEILSILSMNTCSMRLLSKGQKRNSAWLYAAWLYDYQIDVGIILWHHHQLVMPRIYSSQLIKSPFIICQIMSLVSTGPLVSQVQGLKGHFFFNFFVVHVADSLSHITGYNYKSAAFFKEAPHPLKETLNLPSL